MLARADRPADARVARSQLEELALARGFRARYAPGAENPDADGATSPSGPRSRSRCARPRTPPSARLPSLLLRRYVRPGSRNGVPNNGTTSDGRPDRPSGTIDKALELLFHLHEQPARRAACPSSGARSRCRSRPRIGCSRRSRGAAWSSATRSAATGRASRWWRSGSACSSASRWSRRRGRCSSAAPRCSARRSSCRARARAGCTCSTSRRARASCAQRRGSAARSRRTRPRSASCYLAFAPDDVRRARRRCTRFTPATLVDPARARARDRARARERRRARCATSGFPVCRASRRRSARGAAAARRDRAGRAELALRRRTRVNVFRDGVRAAASEIETRVASASCPRRAQEATLKVWIEGEWWTAAKRASRHGSRAALRRRRVRGHPPRGRARVPARLAPRAPAPLGARDRARAAGRRRGDPRDRARDRARLRPARRLRAPAGHARRRRDGRRPDDLPRAARGVHRLRDRALPRRQARARASRW